MGQTYSIGKKEIALSNNAVLILEKKSEDYEWVEVTYQSSDKEILLGSYFEYSFGSGKEWLEYNDDFVVLMKDKYGYYDSANDDDLYYYDDDNFGYIGPNVKIMFDINNEKFVQGTEEELLELYLSSFKNQGRSL